MSAEAGDLTFTPRRFTTTGRKPPSGFVDPPAASRRDRLQPTDAGFTAFVEENYRRLLHMADLLTGDHSRAEDLLQSVLVRTYLRWSKVCQDNPLGYVRVGIVNARTDWWRRGLFQERTTVAELVLPPAPDHSSQIVARDAVLRALALLTARERAVVVLRFYEDLSEVEIADTLGIAAGTVKSTCSRALKKLRISPDLAASAFPSGED